MSAVNYKKQEKKMDGEKDGENVGNISQLATALALAQSEMKSAVKNKLNPFYKSKYADLDSVWATCRIPLTKNGLSIVQLPTVNANIVTVITLLLHSSGEFLKSYLSLRVKDDSPQIIGSGISYARRYGLSAMVGISSDDDDDGNLTGKEIKNTDEREECISSNQFAMIKSIAIKNELSNETLLEKIKADCGLTFDNVQDLKGISKIKAGEIISNLQKNGGDKNEVSA